MPICFICGHKSKVQNMVDELEKERFRNHRDILYGAIRGRQETLVAFSTVAAALLVVATFNHELIPITNSVKWLVIFLLGIIPVSLIGFLLELRDAENSALKYFLQLGPMPKQGFWGICLSYWVWGCLFLIMVSVVWMILLISRSISTDFPKFVFPQLKFIKIDPEWVSTLSTFLLGVLAIFGNQIRKYIFRPSLSFRTSPPMSQDAGNDVLFMYRLIVKNCGKAPARDTRAYIYAITDESGNKRKNFIPVPLNWTHINGAKRLISRNEESLLDVVMISSHRTNPLLCWPRGDRPAEADLTDLRPNEIFTLDIQFYELDRALQTVKLKIKTGAVEPWKVV